MRALILLGVHKPLLTLLVGLLVLVLLASGLPKIYKDTRADAFLAADNPVLVYKNKVKEIFGLSDPVVVAIQDSSNEGIYNLQTLALVEELTDSLNTLDNINEDRTMSLSLDNNIIGTEDGMEVIPFYDVLEDGGPQALRKAISEFPLFDGMLVARDGHMTVIVMELLNDEHAETTYNEILALTNNIPTADSVTIHVAGEGAVLGYLGQYIDRDAKRLNPLAALIITLMLILAFRRLLPALLSNVVILSTVLMTVGFMAHTGVPFFVITNAMPVILIGIAVADSIHIFSHYYECQAKNPEYSHKDCIEEAVITMWRPITLTTFTTMAGFFGLYASAYMPPFEYFGLFTGFGVLVAWFYSIFVLPALIVLLKPKVSKKWVELEQNSSNDLFARLMIALGRIATANVAATAVFFALISLVGLTLSKDLVVNENRINTFHPDEAVYQADKAINAHLEGTNTIDIVIETQAVEGIFDLEVLSKMEALQEYAESLDHVNGSASVVDYLKQMNKSFNESNSDYYTLPENRDIVAQYFLTYSVSNDPTDFDNVVDYDYRLANIRLNLDTSEYVITRPIIEALQNYIDSTFTDPSVTANLSGRVNVSYHWVKDLGKSHFLSVTISLFCVLLISSLLFRSLSAGILTVIPVMSSILVVYATMVLLKIDLGIGTSMFAAVAIGLGVDFAIHTVERLKEVLKDDHQGVDAILTKLYPSTGRALLFNYLAIAFGFGVLMSSQVVSLNNFGTIVVLSVTMSFITAMTLIPALVLLFKPRFFFPDKKVTSYRKGLASGAYFVVCSGLALAILTSSDRAEAQEIVDADEVMRKVDAVEEGDQLTSQLSMTMINKQGKTRLREATSFRKYFGQEKRTFFVFRKPSNVDGTSFLTFDYPDAEQDDDQWLYLPSLRKVRRISSSDRGDFFLGTDFTYEDIKKAGKVELSDFNFKSLGNETINIADESIDAIKIEATPKDSARAKNLGFGNSQLWVNPVNWIIVQAEYQDIKGRALRNYTASDIRQIDGIWTKHTLEVKNHKTGHYSRFNITDIDYVKPVDDNLFTKRAMEKGI